MRNWEARCCHRFFISRHIVRFQKFQPRSLNLTSKAWRTSIATPHPSSPSRCYRAYMPRPGSLRHGNDYRNKSLVDTESRYLSCIYNPLGIIVTPSLDCQRLITAPSRQRQPLGHFSNTRLRQGSCGHKSFLILNCIQFLYIPLWTVFSWTCLFSWRSRSHNSTETMLRGVNAWPNHALPLA